MPDIYRSGKKIPELGAAIKGGVAMVMHKPAEMEYPRSLCAMAAVSNSPMHTIYGMLDINGDAAGTAATMAKKELGETEGGDYARMHWEQVDEKSLAHDAMALDATLSFAHELWSREEADLNAVLAVANPGTPDAELTIGAGKPALVMHRGSILATITARSVLSAAKYAVLLFPSSAVFPTQQANSIKNSFRLKARQAPGVEPLQSLEEIPSGGFSDRKAVIIFVHGLLSTDIGVFDPLIKLLRTSLGNDCAFVGFPHNTLTAIDTNGEALMRDIERAVGNNGPPICFVCHSRGGLVARSAAARLFAYREAWKQKIRGCVTFGTPHEGCPLAEAPNDFLGVLVAVQAAKGGNGFFSLVDALKFVASEKSFAGIRDLRPADAQDSYLIKLRDLERTTALPKAERLLDILAIGGTADTTNGWLASLARRTLKAESDLIVETSSSLSRFITRRERSNSDHFDYFTSSQMESAHFEKVTRFLAERLHFAQGDSERGTDEGGRSQGRRSTAA
jgi:pimeloyl-ACP methyl ester carboxylesterase